MTAADRHGTGADTTDADELAQLASAARRFVDERVGPLYRRSEAVGRMDPELVRLMVGHGYTGMRIDEAWGGQGLSFTHFCTVLRQFARLGPSMHFWLIDSLGLTLQRLGTDVQKARYLRPYSRWEKLGALCFSEPEAGSDAGSIRTKATRTASGWRIDGHKHYISRGDLADFFFVTASTDASKGARGGITTFIVDRGTPGLSIGRVEQSMGSTLHKLAEVDFDGCEVPEDAVLGEIGFGFVAAMKTLDDGRLAAATTCLGTAERLLELMVEHAKTRRTFGAALADRQGVRWTIADTVTEIELGRALLEETVRLHEAGRPIGAKASMCKLYLSETVNRIADRAVQLYGGMGLLQGVEVERLFREVRFLRIGEGASEIQKILIARSVLGRPAREGD